MCDKSSGQGGSWNDSQDEQRQQQIMNGGVHAEQETGHFGMTIWQANPYELISRTRTI